MNKPDSPTELAHHALTAAPDASLPPERLARAAFKLRGKIPAAPAVSLLRQLLAKDTRFIEDPDGRWRLADPPRLTPLAHTTFTVLDLETTGGHSAYNRVIEIGAFRIRDGRVQESFMTPVNPRRKIPLQISYLTGIYDEHVANAPVFEEVAEPLVRFIGHTVFVAHNARFDFSFINAELQRMHAPALDNPVLCTVKLARRLLKDAPSRELGALSKSLGIDLDQERHRAHGDAWATAHILLRCLDILHVQNIDTLEALLRFQSNPIKKKKEKTL